MAVKSNTICQIALVVEDLDRVVNNYRQTFQLPEASVFYLPSPKEIPAFTDGVQGDYSDCRMAVLHLGNMVLEITQPGASDSPWRRWLDQHGPGVQHLGFMVEERDKDEAFASLEKTGSNMYHAGFYPNLTYTFVDGYQAFGLDLNIKWNTDNQGKMAHMLQHPSDELKEI